MAGEGREIHGETDNVRGGSTPHVVRWILGISLLAAIVLLSAVWIFGALSQGDVEEQATVSGTMRAAQDEQAGDDTDGLVIDDADQIEGTSDAASDPLNMPNEAAPAR